MESDANIYKNQIKGFAEVTGNFHPINYYKSADSPRRNSAMVIHIKNNLWLGSMLKSDCKLSQFWLNFADLNLQVLLLYLSVCEWHSKGSNYLIRSLSINANTYSFFFFVEWVFIGKEGPRFEVVAWMACISIEESGWTDVNKCGRV